MNKIIVFFQVFLTLLLFSCSDNPTYSKFDIVSMIKNADENAAIIHQEYPGIDCSLYGDHCIDVYRATVNSYEIIFVQLDSLKEAKKLALQKDSFYLRNWLVDNVQKESPLEKFFLEKIKAEKPVPVSKAAKD
jgi:hypothetical protein